MRSLCEYTMPDEVKPLQATLGLHGFLECWDKEGNLLKTIELNGSFPLGSLFETQPEKEPDDGSDNRE